MSVVPGLTACARLCCVTGVWYVVNRHKSFVAGMLPCVAILCSLTEVMVHRCH